MNELIATGQYGRLFAVVHFASHQWKVTSEDLILIDNELDVACGERIRLEKVRPSVYLGVSHQTCPPAPRFITAEASRGQEAKASRAEGRERGYPPGCGWPAGRARGLCWPPT